MCLAEEILYLAERILGEGKAISLKKLSLSRKLSIADKVKKNLILSKVVPDNITRVQIMIEKA